MNFLWAIGMLLVSGLLQAMITPTTKSPKPASLEEFEFPQFDEGTAQIIVFGDVWLPDWFVLWYGNFRTKDIKSKGTKK